MKNISYVLTFIFGCFIAAGIQGCAEKKDVRQKIATVFARNQDALNSWIPIGSNTKASATEHAAAIDGYLVTHSNSLSDRSAAMSNFLKSTQDKGLNSETKKYLVDLHSKALAQAKNFGSIRRYMISKDGTDNSLLLDTHGRNLYGLVDCIGELAAMLKDDPKPKPGGEK